MAKRTRPEPNPERVAAFNTGLSAESRAAAFLVAKGYRIMARRFRTPVGEIDIIARRFNTIVFVEVKARATLDGAAELITGRGKSRIVAAAEFWLSRSPDFDGCDFRFDAMLVAPRRIPKHITNAFEAT